MEHLKPLKQKNETAEQIRSRALAPTDAPQSEEAERILDKWRDKFKDKTRGWKPFPIKALSVRNLLIAACAVLILLAAYLNLRFSDPAHPAEATVSLEETQTTAAQEEEDYFAIAVINRSRARDEAIDMYQTVADDTGATESSRSAAYASMNELVDRSATEIDVENQIKAKGFSNCVAIIENDRADIIVETEGLTESEVAQITEIVYLKTGVLPQNLTITEKA